MLLFLLFPAMTWQGAGHRKNTTTMGHITVTAPTTATAPTTLIGRITADADPITAATLILAGTYYRDEDDRDRNHHDKDRKDKKDKKHKKHHDGEKKQSPRRYEYHDGD